jgi:O-antigen/teichoic acid export membrane protein
MPPPSSAARARSFVARLRSQLSWRTTRELGWVLAGQAAALAGSIGLTKIIASRLGTEQYGRYALGLTAAVFLNQFVIGPLTTAAIRYFSTYRDNGLLQPYLRALRRLIAGIAVLVLIAVVPAAALLVRYQGTEWAALIVAAAVFGLVQNVFGLLNSLDIAARHRARAAVHQAADPAVRLLVASVLLWVLQPSAVVAMVAIAIAMTLVALSQAVAAKRATLEPQTGSSPVRHFERSDTISAARTLVSYAKYFMVAGLFAWLQLSSDRWALKIYLDDASVGIFAAAYQLASVPSIVLASCVSQFFSPIVFQRARDGNSPASIAEARHVIRVGTMVLILLTVASGAVAAVAGERLVVLFTSPEYRSSGPYVAPLVLGLGLLQIGHMLSLLAMSSNKLKGHLAVRILHGVCAVVLNALAVRTFGLAGLCWASIVSGLIYVVLVLANNARIMRTLSPDAVGAVSPLPVLQS